MIRIDDQSIDELMRLVARRLESTDNDLVYQDERLLVWLANDLRQGMSRVDKSQDERDAEDFARRTIARVAARRAEKALPQRPLRQREAQVRATVSQSLAPVSHERCVTMLDLAVAADGRFLYALDPGSGTIDMFQIKHNRSLTNLGTIDGKLPLFAQGIEAR